MAIADAPTTWQGKPIKDFDLKGREALEAFAIGFPINQPLDGSMDYVVDYGTYVPVVDDSLTVVAVTSYIELEDDFAAVAKRANMRLGEVMKLSPLEIDNAWKPEYATFKVIRITLAR
jgi:hypothetical protein